ALAAAMVAVAVLGATRIRLNADFVSYLSAEDPLVQAYHYVARTFGG
ncbi:MAG: hypothetical protein GWN71_26870, partial [Gammaproteobacteria bacterium]|nr:hypothetical protein [Gammaproteobacteria bacterium]